MYPHPSHYSQECAVAVGDIVKCNLTDLLALLLLTGCLAGTSEETPMKFEAIDSIVIHVSPHLLATCPCLLVFGHPVLRSPDAPCNDIRPPKLPQCLGPAGLYSAFREGTIVFMSNRPKANDVIL